MNFIKLTQFHRFTFLVFVTNTNYDMFVAINLIIQSMIYFFWIVLMFITLLYLIMIEDYCVFVFCVCFGRLVSIFWYLDWVFSIEAIGVVQAHGFVKVDDHFGQNSLQFKIVIIIEFK